METDHQPHRPDGRRRRPHRRRSTPATPIAAVGTFAEDAYVNDNRREFVGIDAIRRWVAKEMVGDKVTIDVREVLDHYGDTIVRGAYDGTFDRTNLPDEVVLTNYFSVRDGKIVSLAVVFNRPPGLLTASPAPLSPGAMILGWTWRPPGAYRQTSGGTMSRVSTYLNFMGQTEEAFHFYGGVFGTEISARISGWGTCPPPASLS